MRRFRVSITGMMGVVLYIAVGLAALLKYTSDLLANSLFTLMVVGLLVATLAISRERRPGWKGFVLFGWVYLVLWYASETATNAPPRFLTSYLIEEVKIALGHYVGGPEDPDGNLDYSSYKIYSHVNKQVYTVNYRFRNFDNIFHLLILPVFGWIGALVERWLDRRDGAPPPAPPSPESA